MSGPRRRAFYPKIVRRDGERCFIGYEPLTFDEAVVDHWNNDDGDNRLSNLHLLCRSMNAVKNPRGKAILRETTDQEKILSSMRVPRISAEAMLKLLMAKAQSAEFLKNMSAQPNFRHLVFYWIVYLQQVEYSEVVVNAAELVDCSQDTIKRYLERLTCAAGMYRLTVCEETHKRLISLKPRWDTFRRANQEKAELAAQAKNWKDDGPGKIKRANVIAM